MVGGVVLIVNADDFGSSTCVNRGVIEAHEHGIVTSASLMVRHAEAPNAVERARAHPSLTLGLHLDLGEWAYRDGDWVPLYEVVPLDDADAVRTEAEDQLEKFRALVGRDPTHLDSHQHVHLREPALSVASDLAARTRVPLRHLTRGTSYNGTFYGQTTNGSKLDGAISVDSLFGILATLPVGVTELCCHPADPTCTAEIALTTMYGHERGDELRVLCDSRIRTAITELGIELRSFAGIASLVDGASRPVAHRSRQAVIGSPR